MRTITTTIAALAVAVAALITPTDAQALRDCRVRKFATAAEITARTDADCIIAYAIDTDVYYVRANGAWRIFAGASGLAGGNGGTIDNETNNAWIFSENSENLTLTFGANTATLASTTGATFILTPATAITGDLTLNGGANALTFGAASSSILTTDNSATGLVIGSTDQLNLLTVDTTNDAEKLMVSANAAGTLGFHVDVGTATFDEGVDIADLAASLMSIRFCGNGSPTGVAHYMGPVLLDDTEADLAFGGAGCDALDNAAEATAEAVWHTSFAFKPTAMVCVGRCTGATAANDAITYQLREDQASVAGMTCTAPAWTGDDNPQQCVVRDSTPPATVAAGSKVSVQFTGTDDACEAVGDDFECIVFIDF